MPRVTFRHPDGSLSVLDGAVGQSAMSLALQNGVEGIIGECGGSCACATCHVYIEEAFVQQLPEMDSLEDDMLEGTACERRSNSRLSCQIVLTEERNGLVIELPAAQL
jgi:2Fe-2S ferredoxin